jgi:hypothetical protein
MQPFRRSADCQSAARQIDNPIDNLRDAVRRAHGHGESHIRLPNNV